MTTKVILAFGVGVGLLFGLVICGQENSSLRVQLESLGLVIQYMNGGGS